MPAVWRILLNDLIQNARTRGGAGQGSPQLAGSRPFSRKLFNIEERVFTEHNLRFYGSGAVIAVGIAFGLLWWGKVRGDWVVSRDGTIGSIDFCWMWVSSKIAASADPGALYDPAAVAALYDKLFGPGECLFRHHQYIYPPTFLFFIYALGFLPYLVAFALWTVATLLLYEVAIYAIVRRSAALIAALTPFSVLKNIQLGHNGFLTAGLMGLSLVFVESRPWLSGVFLGLLTYKPQLGVLFPIALLASRNWRVLAGATVTSVILAAAAAIAFGNEGWLSFAGSLFNRTSGLSPDAEIYITLESAYGMLHRAGASDRLAWLVQAGLAVLMATWLWRVWAKPIPYALKAAILCIGSLVVTPYVLHYDLCVLSIGVAFLVSDGLARGFLPGERMLMLACFFGLFVIAEPVGPVICAALLCLAARRIAAWRGEEAAGRLLAA
jgi:arabinofuranan 3-O-arabinosyltransferase